MLDQHPIFGGEAKQNEFEVDGHHLTAPQGATGIVVPFNRAKEAGFCLALQRRPRLSRRVRLSEADRA